MSHPMDWRYDLGEDVYVIIKAHQLTIHIRKYFVPNGDTDDVTVNTTSQVQ
jgi:hypothetical protein